jgi:uncharacterized Ntn-hydrolase superfamily protein
MTYSIVARDPATGELGVAVQSHFFSVGSICPWAEPGAGAVATQSMAEPSYGPRGLELMASGRPAEEALALLLADDDGRDTRQIGFVDPNGSVGVHTGERCIAEAGHLVGDGWTVQANMMRDKGVPEAMAAAFADATGSLAVRMLAALDAAEVAGGDIRGRQSAALLVAPAEGMRWQRTFDVRVDDHPEPLVELRRLVDLHRSYLEGIPINDELRFWQGVLLASSGKLEEARAMLAPVFAAWDGWVLLLQRLPAAGLAEESTVGALLDT